jgi:hypothetical protein
MNKKLLFSGILVCLLIFSFALTGCPTDPDDDGGGKSALVAKLSAGNIFEEDGTAKWIKDGEATTTILFEKAHNDYFGDFLQVSYNSEVTDAFNGGGAAEALSGNTFEGAMGKDVITAVFSENDTKLNLSGFTESRAAYNGNYTLQP